MPKSAPSRCRCGRIATKRGRCDEHQPKAWERTSKRNQVIDKALWQRVAAKHLRNEPQCRACGRTTHLTVDHIQEVADGGAMYDDSNLQTLCTVCHDTKTQLAAAMRRSQNEDEVNPYG